MRARSTTMLVLCLILLSVMGTSLWANAGQEPTELPVVTTGMVSSKWADYPNNPVEQYIEKTLKMKIEYQGFENAAAKAAAMASGELPDLFIIEATERIPLQDAKYIVPLNDLVNRYGANIKKTMKYALPFVQKYWADAKGDYYGLPGELTVQDPIAYGGQPSLQFSVRWDYFKEIGAPKLTSVDDIVNAMNEMVKKHPKTDTGLRVYGLGGAPANMWQLVIDMSGYLGYQNTATWGMVADNRTAKIVDNYYNVDGPLWKSVYMWYKQNQLGIFDQDLLISSADVAAKAAKGQYVALIMQCGCLTGAPNAVLADQGKGFVAIPIEGGGLWGGGDLRFGSANFRAISAKAKDKALVMKLMDWEYSEDGARIVVSGVPGVHWDLVDGKPKLRQTTIDLWRAGGKAWDETGINQLGNFINTQGYKHSVDGLPLDLFNTDDVAVQLLNATDKDYAKFFGVKTPEGYWNKLIAEGKIAIQDKHDYRVLFNMPAKPDELNRIDSEVQKLIERGVPNVILAANDAAFQAARDNLIADIKKAGYDQVRTWYLSNFDRLTAAMGPKPAK